MTVPRLVMFRAGGNPGEHPLPVQGAAAVTPRVTAAPQVLLADISEFEPEVSDQLYVAWSKAIIIRACYGAQHDDRAWYGGQRRDLLHQYGIRFLGIYAYIVAGQDPVRQADALGALLGALRPGEKVIGDFEEGAGDQSHRRDLWAARIGQLGDQPWIYSGLNYAAGHGLAPVDWVAAYQAAEPGVPHKLWQFTDSFQVPGVGTADCSVFHGTIDDLAALAYGGQQPAQDWTETMIANLPALRQGDADQPGAVQYVHRLQALVAVIGAVNRLPGAAKVTADGIFGQQTWIGLLAVQQFFGLTQDGICGPATWAALVAGQRP